MRFHSISFPHEWGVNTSHMMPMNVEGFHSISFPNELEETLLKKTFLTSGRIGRFHSISFPSKWGVARRSSRASR
jgi:hypothetical protein